ncbi:DGQHR domain-containing protein [Colwellia sp. RSH04]|uniref:DGQHR domain-containing protein n=1 Tax=Colwellia sp. RSH04 TaxID=2305464 RepID=UPI000E573ED4|nr:DGQHR domain-containing protein [Colwellia sp. RSH04]RHW76730.1 DGQHR domain-containing protein [Colwellia sp. RSH04]
MIEFPIKIPAIKVEQPLGEFYVATLTARELLQTCYTIKAEILQDYDDETTSYLGTFVNKLKGNQRVRTTKRLNEIKRYTETVDACFPNSIILGANYDENGNLITNINDRWEVEEVGDGFYNLIIPTGKKLASIIDGQHRVFGFQNSEAKDMSLLCSVFIDLPLPYHASIFTNINMNQKRVDKNLAYNLFQFDMEQGEPSSWTPETLAVYFARVLAEDESSPLRGMIKLGLANTKADSTISMASIIDGILSLITSNPKNDRELMHTISIKDGRNRGTVKDVTTSAPLREYFINNKDKTIFDIVLNFFKALESTLWNHGVFTKTLGVHACFDFLKFICKSYDGKQDYNEDFFLDLFQPVVSINFESDFFGIQTKLRSRIRNILFIKSGLKTIEEVNIKGEELESYIIVLKGKN